MLGVLLSGNTQKAHAGEVAPQLRNRGTIDSPHTQWEEVDTKHTEDNGNQRKRKEHRKTMMIYCLFLDMSMKLYQLQQFRPERSTERVINMEKNN
jgi:hypothetical protein